MVIVYTGFSILLLYEFYVIFNASSPYRSLADQLKFSKIESIDLCDDIDFARLRQIAAAYLQSHSEDFAPFLGMDAASIEFQEYCAKVESVSGAEWGGQIELRALAAALERQIHVYDSSTPLLVMGQDFPDCNPLKVTYHRHYYSLGEHYNSVERIESS